jgi:hypothetical protein
MRLKKELKLIGLIAIAVLLIMGGIAFIICLYWLLITYPGLVIE